MKIYTRRGDRGETSLLGGGAASKDDPRVEAYGTVDELSAAIGLARALDASERLRDSTAPDAPGGGAEAADRDDAGLRTVQDDLFGIGARLAAADPGKAAERGIIPRLAAARVGELEDWIDRLDAELPALDSFVLPGGSPTGAQLHVARTVCRRAERTVVHLLAEEPELGEVVVPYLNRLSDLLFTLARARNLRAGRPEPAWQPMRRRGGGGREPEPEAGEDVR